MYMYVYSIAQMQGTLYMYNVHAYEKNLPPHANGYMYFLLQTRRGTFPYTIRIAIFHAV